MLSHKQLKKSRGFQRISAEHAEIASQFIKFAIVGVANTLVDFGVYLLLTRGTSVLADHIYIANTLAFCSAATFSFFVNKRWTFGRKDAVTVHEAAKFYIAVTGGFALGMTTFYLLVSHAGFDDRIAKLGATVVTVLWNFVLNKFWVFAEQIEYKSNATAI
jgi:putative flippase GtrA